MAAEFLNLAMSLGKLFRHVVFLGGRHGAVLTFQVGSGRSPAVCRGDNVFDVLGCCHALRCWQRRIVVVILHGAAANKVGRRDAVFITGVSYLTAAEVKVKDSNAVTVLVRDNEILTGVIKLKVARGLSSRVKEPSRLEFTNFRALGNDTEDGDRLVSAVGHNDKATRLVNSETPASVHFSRKGTRNGTNGLDEFEGRASLEAFHWFLVCCGSRNLIEKLTVDREYSDLQERSVRQRRMCESTD